MTSLSLSPKQKVLGWQEQHVRDTADIEDHFKIVDLLSLVMCLEMDYHDYGRKSCSTLETVDLTVREK